MNDINLFLDTNYFILFFMRSTFLENNASVLPADVLDFAILLAFGRQ